MVWLLAFDRLTVKAKAVVPVGVKQVVASGFCLWLELSGVLFWSFWIVPVPTGLAIVALVAPDRVTVKVSSGSNAVSAHTSTATGLLASLGAQVNVVLLFLLESGLPLLLPAQLAFPIALTLPVAYFTVMVWVLEFDRLTVKAKAVVPGSVLLFFFNDTATTEIYTLSLHDALPILPVPTGLAIVALVAPDRVTVKVSSGSNAVSAHTS